MNKLFNFSQLKSEFIKNAFILSVGTTTAQAIPLLVYPVLARLFTPEDFGLLATITSITAIVAVLSPLKYEGCILIAESKQDGANVIGLVLVISFILLFISFIVLELLSNHISVWLSSPDIGKWLFVCPLTSYAIIIFSSYNEWCVRNKYFISLSANKIGNSGATTLSKVLLGIVKISSNGLILGELIGRSIIAVRSIYDAFRKDREIFLNISLKRMIYLSKRYNNFPKYFLPSALLNSIGGQIPVLLIGFYFNSTELGYFAMTMSVLSVPVGLIGYAVRDIFRQRANEDFKKTGECRSIFLKTVKSMSILTVIAFIPLIFILPFLFKVVLGEQWIMAGEYSQIVAPMIAMSFIAKSVGGVMIIVEKMKPQLFYQIYYLIITIISIVIGFIVFRNMKMTLVCYTIGMCSVYLLDMYLSYKYSIVNRKIKNLKQ